MSDMPPPKAKIYDRPERKGPPPLVLVIAVLVVLIVGFFLYRVFVHPAAPRQNSDAGISHLQSAFWQDANARPTNAGGLHS